MIGAPPSIVRPLRDPLLTNVQQVPMVSPSKPLQAIYASCKPVRCPSTPSFDLDRLLRASTALEDYTLEHETQDEVQASSLEDDIEKYTQVCEGNPSSTDQPQGLELDTLPVNVTPGQPDNYQHRVRKRRREEEIREVGHVPRLKTLKTLVPLALEAATPCPIDYIDLPATSGAYGAKISKKSTADRVYTLQEVLDLGMRVFPWNGIDPVPFVDSDGRVFMVLAGRPTDNPKASKKTYSQACKDAYAFLAGEAQRASFASANLTHRRGDFPVINIGVTHGMGTLQPTYLDVRPNAEMVEHVLANADFQRIAAYASATFALWMPKTYAYYKERLDLLFKKTGLRHIFRRSIYPSAALNCGPNVCTKKHTDSKNCPFGECSVTSLGHFNPKTGGHLVLWELGLAVEFPSGSTILLPSATISHSNTPILEGETRASFTQYCSGGLFRWVDYEHQTEKDLKKNNPSLYREVLQLRPDRWKMGVDLFSTIAELRQLIS